MHHYTIVLIAALGMLLMAFAIYLMSGEDQLFDNLGYGRNLIPYFCLED